MDKVFYKKGMYRQMGTLKTPPRMTKKDLKLAHGPDEYVNVQAIIDSAKIYALTAVNYLNFF